MENYRTPVTLETINAKLDRLLSIVQPTPAHEVPLKIKDFAARVGKSRSTISRQVRDGMIQTRRGRIPPSELRKFGV